LREALVVGARECGVIGDLVLDAEAAEPMVGEVQLNLAAECAFRADREHIAENEHPDHQLRIDRRPPCMGVVRRQLTVDPGEIQHRCDTSNLMVIRHHRVEIERIQQLALIVLAPPHHRTAPSMAASRKTESRFVASLKPVLQRNRPLADLDAVRI